MTTSSSISAGAASPSGNPRATRGNVGGDPTASMLSFHLAFRLVRHLMNIAVTPFCSFYLPLRRYGARHTAVKRLWGGVGRTSSRRVKHGMMRTTMTGGETSDTVSIMLCERRRACYGCGYGTVRMKEKKKTSGGDEDLRKEPCQNLSRPNQSSEGQTHVKPTGEGSARSARESCHRARS